MAYLRHIFPQLPTLFAHLDGVVIRTNGGTLTINSPEDRVKHYGIANVVDIQAVADSSYFEYGNVSLAKIKTGRLVVTESTVLATVHVVQTNGNYNDIKIGVVGNAELPLFSRDDIDLQSGDKKLVLEVQTLRSEQSVDNAPQYVWISKTGGLVSTDVATSATVLDETTKVESSEQTKAAKASAGDVEDSVTEEELAEMVEVAQRYAGGQGTEENPLLLSTLAHFQSLDEDVNTNETAGKYYKVITDINLGKIYPIGSMGLSGNNGTSSQGYSITYTTGFRGNLDGGNHAITYEMRADSGLATSSNSIGLFGAIIGSEVKNLVINADISSDRASVWVGGFAGFGWGCNMENVTVNGSVTGSHDVGGIFGYYANGFANTTKNTFKNCVNNARVICHSKRTGDNYAIAGGFVGQLSPEEGFDYELVFDGCESNGSISVSDSTCTYSTCSYYVGFSSDNISNTSGRTFVIRFNNCSVGKNAEISSVFGSTRTKNNKTAYSTYSQEAYAACPVIKYIGCTSGTTSANPANYSKTNVYVDNSLQDMTLYFIAA